MAGLIVALIFLPFMQIGASYYASGQTIIIIALLFTGYHNIYLLFTVNIAARIFLSAVVIFATALYPEVSTSDIVIALRQAVCLFILTGVADWSIDFRQTQAKLVLRVLSILAAGMLSLVTIQTIMLSRGIYFGIPKALFVINQGAIPELLDLQYSDIRPMGTFGEPSYLAGVSVVMIFGLRNLWSSSRLARMSVVLTLLTIFVSRSLTGLVGALWLMADIIRRSRIATILVLIACVVFGFTVFLYFAVPDLAIFVRVTSLLEGNDASFAVRIASPIVNVPMIMIDYPLGIPQAQFSGMRYILSSLVEIDTLVQNGLFNILINFGVIGIFVLLLIFISFRRLDRMVLLIILMFQNGSFLAVDKIALITLAMIINNSLTSSALVQDKRHILNMMPVRRGGRIRPSSPAVPASKTWPLRWR